MIRHILIISGLFSRLHPSKEERPAELLPPPPPFPTMKDVEGRLSRKGTGRNDLETSLQLPKALTQPGEEDALEEETPQETHPSREVFTQKAAKLKETAFELLNKAGFVHTEEEKREREIQRREFKKLRTVAKEMHVEERKKKKKIVFRKHKFTKKNTLAEFDSLSEIPDVMLSKEKTIGKKEKRPERVKKEKKRSLVSFKEKEKSLLPKQKEAPNHQRESLRNLELDGLALEKLGPVPSSDDEKPQEVVRAEQEIERAISGAKKTGKRRSLGLFKKKVEPPATPVVETPDVMPVVKQPEDPLLLIEERMHKARLALMDFRFDDAQRIYLQVLQNYNKLNEDQKEKVYEDLRELYYERKSAEKFA